MADVITRFKLETTQFDSKLRDAAKGLREVARVAELGGKSFNDFSQKAIESARALGQTASGANNAKDMVKDLVGSFNDAAKAYNSLTKEQQQSDFGKALSESLDQLKSRIADAKQELYGLGDAVKSSGGLFSGDKLSGMLQVFGGNLMTKAAGIAASFVSEMGTAISQGIELARQTEGVRMAFERLNQPGLLDNLNEATHGTVTNLELMKAAVKFENFKLPLEDLGTYLAFAQQKAKDTGESIDYLVTSIVNGLGRQSVQILDNLGISAGEIKKRMAEGGDMVKVVADIIREEMQKAGDYVETASDRAAKANKELTDAMTELGNTFQPITEMGSSMWNDLKVGALNLLNSAIKPLIESFTELGRVSAQYASQGGDARVNRQLATLRGIYTKQYQKNTYNAQLRNYDTKIGSYEQYLSDYKKWQSDKTAVGAYDRMQAFQKKTGLSMYSDVKEQLDVFKKMRAEYVKGANQIINDNPAPSPASPTTTTTTKTGKTEIAPSYASGSLAEAQAEVQRLAKLWNETGEEVRTQYLQPLIEAEQKVKDMQNSMNLQKEQAQGRLKGGSIEIPIEADVTSSLIPTIEGIQKQLKENPLVISINTDGLNQVNQDAKESSDLFSKAAHAISNMGSAMRSIEDPATKIAGMVAEAVASIALGFSQAIGEDIGTNGSVWYAIIAAAEGVSAMIMTISKIHSSTGYAQGGIVEGNSYSGDNLRGSDFGIDAGELILNRAQQGNLASQLSGNSGGASFQPYVTGEYIFLGANNHTRATGQGEIVTTGMLRNMGLIH